MKTKLIYSVTFYMNSTLDDEKTKQIQYDILELFEPLCETLGITKSTDYAHEFIENEKCNHTAIYFSFEKDFKKYSCAYHLNNILINLSELVNCGDICTYFNHKYEIVSFEENPRETG